MSKQYILAHDLGTSGDKASLYDQNGKLISSTTENYQTYYQKAGWAEQDPNDWWTAVCTSTNTVLTKSKVEAKDVACISFSGQMMGCLAVNKDGDCLGKSIIWADQRAIEETEFMKKVFGEDDLYRITGTSIAPNYSLEKILWLKNNVKEIYDKAAVFLNAKDYIVYRLTSKLVTDYSDASGTNLLDIKKKVWSEDIINASGIDASKLPELHASTDVIGYVTKDAAMQIGLTTNTAVVIGGGDGPCATVGAGAVNEGDLYNYFGSSSWVSVTTSEPLYDPNQATFNLCHLDPKLYMAPGTMQSAGGSYEWMRRAICDSERLTEELAYLCDYQMLNECAKESEPGANGLVFLPYLLGERCPYWNPNARGAFIGLTARHTREDIVRAVFEGPIFNLRVIIDLFKSQGISAKQICAIGGAIESDFICSLMADIYQMELVRPVMLEEATSFGAAVAGGIGVGLIKDFSEVKNMIKIRDRIQPDSNKSEKYMQVYPIFKRAYHALVDIFDDIAKLEN